MRSGKQKMEELNKRNNFTNKFNLLPEIIKEVFLKTITIDKILDALQKQVKITDKPILSFAYIIPKVEYIEEMEDKFLSYYNVFELNYYECLSLLHYILCENKDEKIRI